MPFTLGVLADLGRNPGQERDALRHRGFTEISKDVFDKVLGAIAPEITFEVPNVLREENSGEPEGISVTLTIRSMADFEPRNIAKQVPAITALLDDAEIRSEGCPGVSDRSPAFLDMVRNSLAGPSRPARETSERSPSPARPMDRRASRQLALVMHAPALLTLEGSWRGLHHMVKEAPDDPKIRFEVLNCTREELSDDLTSTRTLDGSHLRRVVTARVGKHGINPLAALVCDFEFSHSPHDVAMLDALASIGKDSHCPVITAASPATFKMKDFRDLNEADRFTRIFESDKSEYAAWNTFRDSPNSSFVAMTVPRFLSRHVYGTEGVTKRAEGLEGFDEFEYAADGSLDGVDGSKLCWSNAAYLAAANIVNAFYNFGIGVAIRGEKNGGLTGSLPSFVYKTRKGGQVMVGPAEVQNGTRADNELSELGFWSMAQLDNQDLCCFYGAQTVQRPRKFTDPDRSNDAMICACLPFILATGRLIHWCLLWAEWRRCGPQPSDRELAADLADLATSRYVSPDATAEHKPRTKPFAEIRIEAPSDPGEWGRKCLAFYLRPHLLDGALRRAAEVCVTLQPG